MKPYPQAAFNGTPKDDEHFKGVGRDTPPTPGLPNYNIRKINITSTNHEDQDISHYRELQLLRNQKRKLALTSRIPLNGYHKLQSLCFFVDEVIS